MKVLVVDVGNSSIKAAEFCDDFLVQSLRFENEPVFREWVENMRNVDHMVVGNVGKIENIDRLSDGRFPVHQAKTDWKSDVEVRYQTLATLGIDRLAGVVGAWDQYKEACIIFDIGTCLTIDYVDERGIYHGGNISPGWGMRLKAMHVFTAKLPKVTMEVPNEIIGQSTQQALQNGAFRAMVYEMKGYIREVKQRNQQLNVILSGGDAFQFAKYLKMEIFVLPDLILRGLYKLLHANI